MSLEELLSFKKVGREIYKWLFLYYQENFDMVSLLKVVLCEMLSKVVAFVDPSSDVEESKIYIQTGKEERRRQLDFCLENHA